MKDTSRVPEKVPGKYCGCYQQYEYYLGEVFCGTVYERYGVPVNEVTLYDGNNSVFEKALSYLHAHKHAHTHTHAHTYL